MGFWKVVSRLFVENAASRALHLAVGFREVGVYEKHGQLEGRWYDRVVVEEVMLRNLVALPSQEFLAASFSGLIRL